jgi:hypothetical protein
MSQTQGGSAKPPQVRADEPLDNLGRRIGLFVSKIRRQTRRMDQPESAVGGESSQLAGVRAEETAQPETEKAPAKDEELVEGMAQRPGHFAAFAGLQIQKTAARVRKEAEAIWAEAQNIRNEGERGTR